MKISTLVLISMLIIGKSFAGEGPTNDLKDVPKGMKLVPLDDDCKPKDPCQKEKAEIAKLKTELAKLKADNTKLRKDIENSEFMRECPEQEVKTVWKTKEIKVPVEKIVEKNVEKIVEKPASRGLTIGVMGAYAQDGLSTSSSPEDAYAVDAYVYKSFIAGPYISVPIGDSFEIGGFGMLGGVNQTFGAKLGYMFK
jgi:hypothetical protein